jgi:hypothetical protein
MDLQKFFERSTTVFSMHLVSQPLLARGLCEDRRDGLEVSTELGSHALSYGQGSANVYICVGADGNLSTRQHKVERDMDPSFLLGWHTDCRGVDLHSSKDIIEVGRRGLGAQLNRLNWNRTSRRGGEQAADSKDQGVSGLHDDRTVRPAARKKLAENKRKGKATN